MSRHHCLPRHRRSLNEYMFHFLRFPKLPTDTDWEHDHHQYHYLHSGLPPAAAGEEGWPSPMGPEPGARGTAHGSSILHALPDPQESISDFYWYYSGKDVIEEQGKRNFSKAMSVAKQVFNSLTEYIQVGSALGDLRRRSCRHPALLLRLQATLCSPGTLHRKPAESGAQSPLGCRGGLPARVRAHDDEAGSGLSSSENSSFPPAIP